MQSERARRFPAPRRGQLGFILAFCAVSAVLILNIRGQTQWFEDLNLFAQPRFWPLIGLLLMTACGLAYLYHLPWKSFGADDKSEALRWLGALEYAGWFLVYVLAVPIIGYLLATLIFMPAIVWRLGYKSRKFMWLSVVFGFGTVILFKSFLSVKIPGGAIYEFLPNSIRSFFLLNF
jgi:hypothetical protein